MTALETAHVELVAANRDVIRGVSTGRPDAYMIPLSIVRIREGFNDARKADPDYPAHVRELADSMKANGWMRHKPLVGVITPDGFAYPSDGHTRYEAALLANSEGAGIESIPFMPEQKGTNEEDRIFGLILNNNGKRLTPMGEALVIKQLVGRGIEEKEIARRLGFSTTKVANALALVAAPAPIRAMVAAGEVSATTAVKTIREKGAAAIATLEEGKAVAKAAGKTKVTEKHLKPTPPKQQANSDAARLDWIEARRDVAIRQWYREGQISFFAITDSDDVKLAGGPTLREAIDAAMLATKDEA
ncbi:ParB/RepB/Spo0J family partition protein [Burkholderia contaminans]|uniref:ParB/RepB/Spo0J family partition protein n=1 Tax=Burkholderia TaxID=32008 RepID=UPI0010F44D3E|nr:MULTISPECIES: ParB/RepB/Spo0J family partition protein [Burkholderia]MBD1412897.1 ParB/RepB/Spo0J family partition protein [Burkholderia contaminans]UXZ68654.1 ParB/RepB/Spo0J family partition protein [Burkholderia contaminans]UXZ76415.1 ParB/RepB/Spo0J family partition protein [Burkholderia contaminans]